MKKNSHFKFETIFVYTVGSHVYLKTNMLGPWLEL